MVRRGLVISENAARVAALYDIHGNLFALEAVLNEIRDVGVDLVLIGGDVLPGPMPRETLARLMAIETPVRFILGSGCGAAASDRLPRKWSRWPAPGRPSLSCEPA
jgi:hypothetical protein